MSDAPPSPPVPAQAPGDTSPQWRRERCHALWAQQGGTCFHCGQPMADPLTQRTRHRKRADAATIDHVMPRALGGAVDWGNEVAACRACNAAKADAPPDAATLERLRHLKITPPRPGDV